MQTRKRLSILGDSISTYKGYSNDAAACAATHDNPYFYREPFPPEKTYWMRLLYSLDMSLCVNNSWSGGNLSDRSNPDSGVSRACHLSRDDGTKPDLIILFMGINDLGRHISRAVFAEDYERTLSIIKEAHPKAHVCCVNLPDRDIVLKQATEEFNAAIEAAVRTAGKGFFIADLFHSRLNNDFYYDNTLDGLHPDEDGMRIIAEVIEEAVKTEYAST